MFKTKEIAEAAILYMHNLSMESYDEKYWNFDCDVEVANKLRLDLINKKLLVEPLEFMESVRRVKSFSNGQHNGL